MDVKNFQDSRNTQLEAFKKQYGFLKTHYSSVLSSAINEPDPAKQQTLISQIQQINSQLTNEVHGILSILNKGDTKFDPKQLDDLTNDLIQYQKDYDELEKSKDKVSTLKIIANTMNSCNQAARLAPISRAISQNVRQNSDSRMGWVNRARKHSPRSRPSGCNAG